jgi:hypothetical protein
MNGCLGAPPAHGSSRSTDLKRQPNEQRLKGRFTRFGLTSAP